MITAEIKAQILAYLAEKDKMRARSLAYRYLNSLAEADRLLEELEATSKGSTASRDLADSQAYEDDEFEEEDEEEYEDDEFEEEEEEDDEEYEDDEFEEEEDEEEYEDDEFEEEEEEEDLITSQQQVANGLVFLQANLSRQAAKQQVADMLALLQQEKAAHIISTARYYISQGWLSDAIKFVRKAAGISLSESKWYVRALQTGNADAFQILFDIIHERI